LGFKLLLDELLSKGIRACGTVRKNRKNLPHDLLPSASQLQEHEYTYRQKGELGALVWKDRRLVFMLTTHTSPAEIISIERKSGNESTIQRSVPKAVADYNQHKSGVDTIDQLHANYSIGRKSKKWWPRLIWWLIDMCIINAYSLYQQKQQVQISQLEFRERLMQELMQRYPQERARTGRPPHTPNEYSQQPHWPAHSDERADCTYCSNRVDSRTRSRIRCDVCNVALCIDPCFKLFHMQH
jgi:Transposase IS4